MMAQYHAIKERYPDALLFYRMGDFYELFFNDAEIAAKVLDITLTKRGKNQGNEIPMAGVPYHSYEPYLARLIRAGHRVAICEQTESPEEARKKRGAKALVERDVVRIVTAGTLTEDHLLNARESNYLAAASVIAGECALAWLDLSTGSFAVQRAARDRIAAALETLNASEYVLHEELCDEDVSALMKRLQKQYTAQPKSLFDSSNAQSRLQEAFNVDTLDSFGDFSRAEISAAGALIDYASRTQLGKLPHIAPPRQVLSGASLEIDPATRRNLELFRTLAGESKGSLLHAIDKTVSAAGGRLLAEYLSAPLTDINEINARLDKVETFHRNRNLRAEVNERLETLPDIERALARITAGRGTPRDLANLRDGFIAAEQIDGLLEAAQESALAGLQNDIRGGSELGAFTETLCEALADELPLLARDGGFIREGYSLPLDELKSARDDSRKLIAGLQGEYRGRTGIDALKISYNNMLGYFIEVPAKKADALMIRKGENDNPFVHRQTLANAVRFTTPDLNDLESKIASAAERAKAIELEIFDGLITQAQNLSAAISRIAKTLAVIDVFLGLAELAEDRNYTRPVITNDSAYEIIEGRHPVVENALEAEHTQFTPNDCNLSADNRLWLLTGPNMAGKSTFLRQNALIAIMAQIGAFVPAGSARIGVIDKLFSRVGASDDLARGRSTFMVEMVETAAILNQATERSLVILDEIGRGTATFDGLSIAWACVEHLHEVSQCRTLFATHYHELTSLQARLDKLSCHSMQVREWKGEIVFLHKVAEGAADRSYGIHVGKLAGLPGSVIARAEEVLSLLQKGDQGSALTRLADDLPLFTAATAAAGAQTSNGDGVKFVDNAPSPLEEKLRAINPDDLTPKEALEVLYGLKEALKHNG